MADVKEGCDGLWSRRSRGSCWQYRAPARRRAVARFGATEITPHGAVILVAMLARTPPGVLVNSSPFFVQSGPAKLHRQPPACHPALSREARRAARTWGRFGVSGSGRRRADGPRPLELNQGHPYNPKTP